MAQGRTAGIVIGWIATALATAGLAGGLVFVVQSKQAEQLRMDLDSAQRQITELQSGDDANDGSEPSDEAPADSRKLLTFQVALGLTPDCEEKFNTEEPTTTEHVKVPKVGVELDVPYNPDWGSDRFRIEPSEVTTGGEGIDAVLSFGPYSIGEGCGWYRQYSMYAKQALGFDEELANLEADQTILMSGEPEDLTLGGNRVIRYQFSGLCGGVSYIIIGKDRNIVFNPICASGTEEERPSLEKIVASVDIL